jgi:hypothetical protein
MRLRACAPSRQIAEGDLAAEHFVAHGTHRIPPPVRSPARDALLCAAARTTACRLVRDRVTEHASVGAARRIKWRTATSLIQV